MAEIKFTKSELRVQRQKLMQLERYLPTLQLKKAMLQSTVNEVKVEILRLEKLFHECRLTVSSSGVLASEQFGFNLSDCAKIEKVVSHYENIAGVVVPLFDRVEFSPIAYPLFSTPPWLDTFVEELRKMAVAKAEVKVMQEKKIALEKELREVTIRVNLFEKNLIPKTVRNIRRIRVFLGDQELAAIAQAKVAKTKIEKRKRKVTE